MMHGKSPKKQEKQRSLEDFIVSMQRVSPTSYVFSYILGFHATRDYGIERGKKQSVDNFMHRVGRLTFVFFIHISS